MKLEKRFPIVLLDAGSSQQDAFPLGVNH